MKRLVLCVLSCGLLNIGTVSAPAAVTMSGNVVNYHDPFSQNYPNLIVGNSQDGAAVIVNGGSELSSIPNYYGNPSSFLLYLGGIFVSGGTATSSNSVTVAGTNSYLECGVLRIGSLGGSFNSVTVSDGAVLHTGVSMPSLQDYDAGSDNSILVTGPGSLLQGTSVTLFSARDSVRVENGGHLSGQLTVSGSNSVIVVTGTNSVVDGGIYGINVGGDGSSLTVSNHAQVNGNLLLQAPANGRLDISQDSLVNVDGVTILAGNTANVAGNLIVSGQLYVPGGALHITGKVQTDSLTWSGSGSFNSGTLIVRQANISAGAPFLVGDGVQTAAYIMKAGTHTFSNALVISSNSILSGCGSIVGDVTNYGTILLTNGCDMDFSNSVVNFGVIVATNGTPHFHSGFENYGTLITNAVPVIVCGTPVLAGGQFLLDFTVSNISGGNFTLLVADQPNGPWTTNSTATLTTNLPGISYQFTTSAGNPSQYYRVQAP